MQTRTLSIAACFVLILTPLVGSAPRPSTATCRGTCVQAFHILWLADKRETQIHRSPRFLTALSDLNIAVTSLEVALTSPCEHSATVAQQWEERLPDRWKKAESLALTPADARKLTEQKERVARVLASLDG
jgi:hypothetical protein